MHGYSLNKIEAKMHSQKSKSRFKKMRARGEGLDFKRRAKDLISLESPFLSSVVDVNVVVVVIDVVNDDAHTRVALLGGGSGTEKGGRSR